MGMKITIDEIAKLIAGNYDDWREYRGKAKKVIKYIKSKKKFDTHR